jgi:hypothetical protein
MAIPARLHHQTPIAQPKFLDPHAQAARPLYGPKALLGARLFSLMALCLLMLALLYGAATGYRVLNDSFVAPIIFSPDNDLVIQNKLNLSRLLAERQRILTRVAESTAALEIGDRAVVHLLDFKRSVSKSLAWSVALTSKQAAVSAQEVEGLEQQRLVIENMTRDQEKFVAQMQQNLDAGLVRKSELERSQGALDQLRLAWLQNARDRMTAQVQLDTASLAQDVLSRKSTVGGLVTPEMAAQRDHLMRVELDLMKLQAERQAKLAQQRTDQDELLKIDELIADMKRRPIFRAIEVSQNVAFVPYSQRDAVAPGSDVFDCKVWTVFACSHVGKVSELLPGEVATQDPWGTPTRGQYALLDLNDPAAAMSKALRVRTAGGDLVTHTLRMMRQGWQHLGVQADALRRDAANTVGRLSTRR